MLPCRSVPVQFDRAGVSDEGGNGGAVQNCPMGWESPALHRPDSCRTPVQYWVSSGVYLSATSPTLWDSLWWVTHHSELSSRWPIQQPNDSGWVRYICFAGEGLDSLSVAHVTGDSVEVLPPLRVTDTHVVVNITDLSLWGLVRMFKPFLSIKGQVLPFLQSFGHPQSVLNVIVLPSNVPLNEVQSKSMR